MKKSSRHAAYQAKAKMAKENIGNVAAAASKPKKPRNRWHREKQAGGVGDGEEASGGTMAATSAQNWQNLRGGWQASKQNIWRRRASRW